MTEKRYEKIWEHGKIIGTKDTKNHVFMNIKTMIRELNSQDARIKELETVIQEILYETRANHTKREYSVIVSVSPQMHDKLTDLIREKMW